MYSLTIENLHFPEGADLKIFIDGELVDTISIPSAPEKGLTLESNAITEALEGREVMNTSFVGTMVMVTTEPIELEEEFENE